MVRAVTKSPRDAFDHRLVIAEPHLPWALPSTTPRKSTKSACPRCDVAASPGGPQGDSCNCPGTHPSHGLRHSCFNPGPTGAQELLPHLSPSIHASPNVPRTELRCARAVSFSAPTDTSVMTAPPRCDSERLQSLRSVWLGSRMGSVAGPSLAEGPGKNVRFMQESILPGSSELMECGVKNGVTDEEDFDIDQLEVELEQEKLEGLHKVENGNENDPGCASSELTQGCQRATRRGRSFQEVQELRTFWLGSRQGSIVTGCAEEMSVAPVTRSLTLGRRRKVMFTETRAEKVDDDCEGEEAQAAARVEELRSIWLGSRQGSIGRSGTDGEADCEALDDGSKELLSYKY